MNFNYMSFLLLLICAATYAQSTYAPRNNQRRGYATRYREQYNQPRGIRAYRYRSAGTNSDPYTSYKAYGQTWNWYPFYGDSNNAYYYPARYYEYPFWRYDNNF